MRGYYVPLVAGAVLAVSAFMPRVQLGDQAAGGMSGATGLWSLVLGLLAVLLATLSVITRKNSRHPLLLVGLIALAIELLGWQWMRHSVNERAWASAQAAAIVAGRAAVEPDPATMHAGLYLGLGASAIITGFGLTIVVKQAAKPYAAPQDDL